MRTFELREILKCIRLKFTVYGCKQSLYLDQVATLRDLDWDKLQHHFEIPQPVKELDHVSIVYKNGKLKAIEESLYKQDNKNPAQLNPVRKNSG